MSKPIIETLVNTTALALTSFGVLQITTNQNHISGYTAIAAGMLLEFFKYVGRQKKLW